MFANTLSVAAEGWLNQSGATGSVYIEGGKRSAARKPGGALRQHAHWYWKSCVLAKLA